MMLSMPTSQLISTALPRQDNPKILHRIYHTNYRPFKDPYLHFRETWERELPEYKIMDWDASNLNSQENEWTRRAEAAGSPVFLSEYFRWKVLSEYGGLYLDADCEILDGVVLRRIIDELYAQDDYDVFFGVEDRSNGHPTAQTVGAKKGADLPKFMLDLYTNRLAPLWEWRERRGLLGPSLMGLYFLDKGINVDNDGFFKNLQRPKTVGRAKVYPQQFFSPKFGIGGDVLNFKKGQTCIYHMFANSNIDFSQRKSSETTRTAALTFKEYAEQLAKLTKFPRRYDASHFLARIGKHTETGIAAGGENGLVFYGPYVTIPRGRYVAEVQCDRLPSRGVVTLSATEDHGARTLAARSVAFGATPGRLELEFEVTAEAANHFEVTLAVSGVDKLHVTAVTIREQGARKSAPAATTKGSLKTLHRIYFGFDGKPDQFGRYLETWKQQLPDFNIVHWNASNLPMDINPYVRELYAEKDHAFLTDFFRWYVLREYGGTYLDADVEVVNGDIYRQLVSELESDDRLDAFIGIDERSGGWYTAHSMASKPDSDITKFMCDVYANFGKFTAWRKKGLYFWAPQLVGLYFASRNHHKAGMGTTPNLDKPVVVSRVKIFPQEWFSPLSPAGGPEEPFLLNGLSENTCLCHHFACSWHDDNSPYARHAKARGGQANVLLRDIIGSGVQSPARTGGHDLVSARSEALTAAAGRQEIRFSATDDNISTIVGWRREDGIATTGRSGCLIYGPYVFLDAGEYEVSIHLGGDAKLHRLAIDVMADSGDTLVFRGRPKTIVSADRRLQFRFVANRSLHKVEFRLFTDERSAFRVTEICAVKVA